MKKHYLVLVDGKLWDRKVTRAGAEKVADTLRQRGINATVAYEMEGKSYEPR